MNASRLRRGWSIAIVLLVVAAVALALSGRARRERPVDVASLSATPTAQVATGTATLKAGMHRREIGVGGRSRSYLVYVPSDRPEGPSAAVVVFHGGGGNAENAVRMSHFDRSADQHGFIAVFPDGVGRLEDKFLTFNSGNCCGVALSEKVDDVAFTRALVQDLATVVPLDYDRLYVTGMSNGGMMTYRLACEAADLFAAAAPVAGANNLDQCNPSRAIALLAVHGTADRSVKFEGGRTDPAVRLDANDRVDRSVVESIDPFLRLAKCTAPAAVTLTGDAERHVFPCTGGAVEVLAVVDGGHAWPGGERGSAIGDQPSKTVDATEAIWTFFAAHPRR